jgi:RNA-binding protein NOB1
LAKLKLEKTVNVAGFYMPTKKEKTGEDKEAAGNDSVVESIEKLDLNESEDKRDESTNEDTNNEQDTSLIKSEHEAEQENADENNNKDNETNQDEESTEEEEGEDGENDDEGWIKPSNLHEIQKQSMVEADQQEIHDLSIKVACMTSDFAMQVTT